MSQPNPMNAFVRVQRVADSEIRRTFATVARQVARELVALMSKGTFSAKTEAKRLQIVANELERIVNPHWNTVNSTVARGIRSATAAAAQIQLDWERDIRSRVGPEAAQLVQGYRAAANRIANQYINHGFNGKPLSRRVYHARDLDNDRIRNKVRSGILLGQSPKQIAGSVESYIKPTTPGGTPYAAMRVARTEMNNAFHDTARTEAEESPWTESLQWHLSGSHPEPDECNEYAEKDKFELGKGRFPVGKVPEKPHPQCLCFITPNLPAEVDFIAMLRARQSRPVGS